MGHLPLFSKAHYPGAGLEVEQAELKPEPTWDVSIFTWYAVMSAPVGMFFSEHIAPYTYASEEFKLSVSRVVFFLNYSEQL